MSVTSNNINQLSNLRFDNRLIRLKCFLNSGRILNSHQCIISTYIYYHYVFTSKQDHPDKMESLLYFTELWLSNAYLLQTTLI